MSRALNRISEHQRVFLRAQRAFMKLQNTPVPPERKGGIAMIELVPGARTGSAAVMVGAVGDPKIPPFKGE